MGLTQRILIAMGLGLALGVLFNVILSNSDGGALDHFVRNILVSGLLDTIGQIFVNLLKLLVVPLVFVSLVLGTLALGNNARVGIYGRQKRCALFSHNLHCH